jgi:hypothetical protein
MQVVDFQARKKGIRKVPFSLNGGERGMETIMPYHTVTLRFYLL